METDKRVQILLSTYNGEEYLQEQLDSYFAMEGFEQCCVFIRDDGSTDGTRSILKQYENYHNFRIVYGENIGVNLSFYYLIENSDRRCMYYALSDQDDIWLPNKISAALKLLEHEDQTIPLLYASQSRIVDAELKTRGASLLPVRGLSYYNAMVQNPCPGHTQVFNRRLRDLLLKSDFRKAHVVDWYIYLIASGVGRVLYSTECSVLHRQHGNNTIGYETNGIYLALKRLRRVCSNEAACITLQLQEVYDSYQDILISAFRKETERFLNCQKNLLLRVYYAVLSKCYRQTIFETILFRILYVAGKYKARQ